MGDPRGAGGRSEAMMNQGHITRRRFLQAGAAASTALAAISLPRWMRPGPARARGQTSPSARLDLGLIGCGNRALGNIAEVLGENIVAVCDVDQRYIGALQERWPQTRQARVHRDFRRMLEREKLDAVVISTPDHTHALPSIMALELGMHVYCEKPLSRTVHEARVVTEAARRSGRATQMGTQIHAGANFRRVVELVRAGSVGPIGEVHVWCERSWAHQDLAGPTDPPADLDWDLWLGPAPQQPYRDGIHPAQWRRYWDFGNGTLGDMACHYLDLPYWALEPGHPDTIEAVGPPPHPTGAPTGLVVTYEYPARGDMAPLRLTWYDGDRCPTAVADQSLEGWPSGVLFVGQRGCLLADYSRHQLLPAQRFADFVPPAPTIPDSIGHHREWLEACRTGAPTTCHFGYAGPLTEAVLLGAVAFRARAKLHWDAAGLRATNAPDAQRFVGPEARPGWAI